MAKEVATREFCKSLPKVELHAHLNGSCRNSTLHELANGNTEITHDSAHLLSETGDRTLAECFKLFDIIHKVTTSTTVITRITKEMCEDLAADNVMYAEIRTTPKNRPECNITKRTYTEAVLNGIYAFRDSLKLPEAQSVTVRLLLSIDRREEAEAALQTVSFLSEIQHYHLVELAKEYRDRGVVGIDLSGNPTVGRWESWLAALTAARDAGLQITLHGGEVPNESEVDCMLAFAPDRLGHMCCLTEKQAQALVESKVPLEICLTSNDKTESVPGYDDHHFRHYLQAGHPVALCTDDSGVFQTTLSQEYFHAAETFSLQGTQMVQIVRHSIDAAFVDDDIKTALRIRLQECVEHITDEGELSSSVTGSRRVFVLCDLRFCGAASDKTCRHCKVARICGECRPSGHCAEASAVNQQATKFTPLGTSNELLCRATLVAAQVVAGTFKRVSGHDKRASTGNLECSIRIPGSSIRNERHIAPLLERLPASHPLRPAKRRLMYSEVPEAINTLASLVVKSARAAAYHRLQLHFMAEVIRRELAEHPGVLQKLNIDSSSLEVLLDATMPPHCMVCATAVNIEVCSSCHAIAWCPIHRGEVMKAHDAHACESIRQWRFMKQAHKRMSASGDYREARTSLRQVTTAVADLTMKNPHMLLDCQSEYGLLHESTLKSLSCTAQLQAAPAAYEAQEHTRLSDPWKLLVSRSAANPATECAMPSRERTCKPKSSTRGDVLPPHVLQWLGALGTYAATTRMWLWQYAPQARNAARVCVHWVGASICEVESIPLLEGILLHSLPQCQELFVDMIGPDLQAYMPSTTAHAPAAENQGASTAYPVHSIMPQLCKDCRERKRSITVRLHACRYQDVALEDLNEPDITCMFHPGLAAEQPQIIEGAAKQINKKQAAGARQKRPVAHRQGDEGVHEAAPAPHKSQRSMLKGEHHTTEEGLRPPYAPRSLIVCTEDVHHECTSSNGTVMPSLKRAWISSLNKLSSLTCPVLVTAFSMAEASDEVQVLREGGVALTHEPERNPWRSQAPRATPLPMLYAATCRGRSPLWTELAQDCPNPAFLARLFSDWLHVNCVVFGHCGELPTSEE